MSRRMLGLFTAASLAILSSPLLAESTPADRLNQRIDLDLAEAAPADVFSTFAEMLGAKLDLSPAVSGKITIRLRNVTAQTSLDAVCESIGCRSEVQWGEKPVLRILSVVSTVAESQGQALRESLDSPMSLSLKDAAAMDVLISISRMLEAELQVQKTTAQTVTLELQGVPARQALDAVGALIQMSWELLEERIGGETKRILKISPRDPGLAAPKTPAVGERG